MALAKALQKFIDRAKDCDAYWVEKTKLDFAMSLENQRRVSGMTYAALAKKIATSAAYITKVFRGESNLTIESMVKLARATGGRLNIEVVDASTQPMIWNATHRPQRDRGDDGRPVFHRTAAAQTMFVKNGMAAPNEYWKDFKAAA